jgi:Asp-tRNA(Asn)/Glu-tRNA(Gln) amidotransferase B subunit
MEAYSTLEFVDPANVIDNKVTLLEHITRKEINKEEVKDRVMEEYSAMDKSTRILAYKMLIEKFNEKYGDLTNDQKLVLKEFINNVSSTTKLKDFVNNNIDGIKKQLIKLVEKVEDNTIKIKINEVVNLIKPLDKNQSVKDEDIITLLTYHQLVAELKSVK